MSKMNTVMRQLAREIPPTGMQLVLSIILSLTVLATINLERIFSVLRIDARGIQYTGFTTLIDRTLDAPLASNVVLVGFWAAIGLGGYLVVWTIFSVLASTRDKVIASTSYTNAERSKGIGIWLGLIIKIVFGALTVALFAAFSLLVNFWSDNIATALTPGTPLEMLIGALSVVGFAAQLYTVLLLIQLALTPWYREDAFTNNII